MHASFFWNTADEPGEVSAWVDRHGDVIVTVTRQTIAYHDADGKLHTHAGDVVDLFLTPDRAVALAVAIAEASPELRGLIEFAIRCMDDDERTPCPICGGDHDRITMDTCPQSNCKVHGPTPTGTCFRCMLDGRGPVPTAEGPDVFSDDGPSCECGYTADKHDPPAPYPCRHVSAYVYAYGAVDRIVCSCTAYRRAAATV